MNNKRDLAAAFATLFLHYTGTDAAPLITAEPADKAATVWGDRITLSVSATGTPPLSYQWHFANAPLPGQTRASLVLSSVTFTNAGAYFAVVSDASGSVNSRVATLTVPEPAMLDDRFSANLRLGEDPVQLASNRRAQVSPQISRNHFQPNLLVATFQEGRYEDGAAASAGYSISRDGGLTWSRALVPNLTTNFGGIFIRANDPVAAVDLDGRIFLSHGVSKDSEALPTTAVISRSTDGGATFGPPTVVFNLATETYKTWLTVNTFPNSPTANRLVAMCNVSVDGIDTLRSSFSDDHGETWSTPQRLGPPQGAICQTFFLPDGSLGVVYFHYLTDTFEPTGSARTEFIHSPDGGQTFTEPVVVTDMSGRIYDDPVARNAWDVPRACTDRQAGIIYVTYQAQAGPPGSRVPQIHFTRSIDRGRSWSPPVVVNDTPARRGVFNPCIAASPDGQHITIAFYDKRHNTPVSGGNLTDYYLAESFDGGETWEPNLRLSEVSSDLRMAPLTGSGRMFADYQGIAPAVNRETPGVAVWIDTRSGNPDPYAIRIPRIRGADFETWRKLRFTGANLDDEAVSGFGADEDGDGLSNRMEFLLGLEPRHVDPNPLRIETAEPHTGTVKISYQGLEANAGPYVIRPYFSTNLIDWKRTDPHMELPETVQVAPDPSWTRTTVEYSTDPTHPFGATSRFFRLKAYSKF